MSADVAHALDALAACAVQITGFSPDAIQPSALQRFLARAMAAGSSATQIAAQAKEHDALLVRALTENVTVGETYFFRHPEQFDAVVSDVLTRFDWSRPFRAWSAGCATGEETWSVASCLHATAPAGAAFEVTGSDILARNVALAEAGLYGSWSVRRLTPIRFPALARLEDGRHRVLDALRPMTRFRVANLLETTEADGPYDLIFCRNVLVYFSDDTRREAIRRLRSTLAPDGVLLFGAMDVDGLPEGFVRAGPPELQMYARSDSLRWKPAPAPARVAKPVTKQVTKQASPPVSQPPPSRPPPPRKVAPPAPPPRPRTQDLATTTEPLVLHLEALLLMERGADRDATRVLDELVLAAPEYVAGLVERALLYQRQNSPEAATALMRRVASLAGARPVDEELPGPEPLPARFYVESAEAFLARRDGGVR